MLQQLHQRFEASPRWTLTRMDGWISALHTQPSEEGVHENKFEKARDVTRNMCQSLAQESGRESVNGGPEDEERETGKDNAYGISLEVLIFDDSTNGYSNNELKFTILRYHSVLCFKHVLEKY